MATRRIAQTKGRAITTPQDAWLEAKSLSATANGASAIVDFLGDLHGGSISMSVPPNTKEWLDGILVDWLRGTAAEIEERSGGLERFLKDPASPRHVVGREGGA